MKKIYTLPDGEKIDLSKIESIGELKSVRSNEFKGLGCLGYWCFKIIFKDLTSEEIQAGYHYNDWGKVKIELQKIRDEILEFLI